MTDSCEFCGTKDLPCSCDGKTEQNEKKEFLVRRVRSTVEECYIMAKTQEEAEEMADTQVLNYEDKTDERGNAETIEVEEQ